jgi:hypothetical protein
VRTGALKTLAAAHLALSSGFLIHDPAGGYISYLSAPPYQAVCVVVGRHRVPQSLKTQCDADRSTGPALALTLAFASACLCLWPPAHCKHSRHPSRCPCNVLHPCMADSSTAWWRCLASDPGRDTGHSRQLFRPLAAGSESKQPQPCFPPRKIR